MAKGGWSVKSRSYRLRLRFTRRYPKGAFKMERGIFKKKKAKTVTDVANDVIIDKILSTLGGKAPLSLGRVGN